MLMAELMQGGKFNPNLDTHQAIWRLATQLPSASFASTWNGPDHTKLLQTCNGEDWVDNFAHIATLFCAGALTHDIISPSPELIAHLLHACPQIVDMKLENFSAEVQDIAVLEVALSSTHHLRSFHITPEDMDPGVGLSIARGLRSHHHLSSWRHWTDDQPDAIAAVLSETLSSLQDLQCLELCIDESWTADHFDQIAVPLMRMPALQDLRLRLAAGCDLSRLFQTMSRAGSSLPLASLTVDIDRAPKVATRNTAAALTQAIASLLRLTSLTVSCHVFEAMGLQAWIGAVRRNGAFSALTLLDVHGDDLPRELPAELSAALATNRDRFAVAPVEMMAPACSSFLNAAMAQHQLGPVSDIGPVVAEFLVGRKAAPDMRDCQGVIRVSKTVWAAARAARRHAMLALLQEPSTQRTGPHMLHLVKLGRKFDILTADEMLQLCERHSRWIDEPSARQ
ncbi:hypothetical protein ASE08_26105 [Rhizobacter sp. Root16D2]|nr:hypothetical protein ASE08_26105 [Rhizobacter sp. Root16D2]